MFSGIYRIKYYIHSCYNLGYAGQVYSATCQGKSSVDLLTNSKTLSYNLQTIIPLDSPIMVSVSLFKCSTTSEVSKRMHTDSPNHTILLENVKILSMEHNWLEIPSEGSYVHLDFETFT